MEMGIEGIDYQFLRSGDFTASSSTCELIEVTTALACACGDPTIAVQAKTGIGRFFLDLKHPPYTTLFNEKLNGAKAFNATAVLRIIDKWIDTRKITINKKSGPTWGVLVHGNRIIACAVFKKIGPGILGIPINEFRSKNREEDINRECEEVYSDMVKTLEDKYAGKFLAVLFKNPSMSRDVFDEATK
jgi:hypothetical protein